MNLQYILDSTGKATGVFIPITEWNKLKEKFTDIEEELEFLPEWHKEIIDKRLTDYKNNSEQVLDFDSIINEIEKEL
ncbi:MAG: addiction module protein [bacterium]|nr:addiction module protein [bacterium]